MKDMAGAEGHVGLTCDMDHEQVDAQPIVLRDMVVEVQNMLGLICDKDYKKNEYLA